MQETQRQKEQARSGRKKKDSCKKLREQKGQARSSIRRKIFLCSSHTNVWSIVSANMTKTCYKNKTTLQRLPPAPVLVGLGWGARVAALPGLVDLEEVSSTFLAFFSSLVFLILSLISRKAASLAAARTSVFSVLFFWITSREAPTMERE